MKLEPWARRVMRPRGFAPAPHHRLLLAHLDRLARQAEGRLIVMMPPGSAKSTYASVVFPAWWLLRRPRARII
ncbi:MAG: hypothetical protein J0I21_00850, partial [Alphaproteobacteria bacterium]|nr:hypothetical protein [Alphaproteobacteria bacterium]